MLSKKLSRFLPYVLCALIYTLPAVTAHAVNNTTTSTQQNTVVPFGQRTEVKAFIQQMHKKHGLNQKNLKVILNTFSTEHKVLRAMSRQYEALPWYRYRDTIVTEKRVKEGVQFWKAHKDLLKKAEKQFGVPAEIVVALLGIETSYGQITGKYPVLQALATLAFDYPRRAAFFKSELEHFLLLANEGALDPIAARGSFAGAMGIPQFMPSSYKRYAVDFSGTGKRDLLHDIADVIGSVANYLKENGWKKNEPIISALNQKTILSGKNRLILLEKNVNHEKERWMGFHNFNVIMRYNNSTHYAMAVYQLSQKIRMLKKG